MSKNVISEQRAPVLRAYLDERVGLGAWDEMAGLFDSSLPAVGEPDRLEQLAVLSERWDSRNGKERNEAGINVHVQKALEKGDEAVAIILGTARTLGNIGTSRLVAGDIKDLTCVMGAGGDANLMRSLHARGLGQATAYLGVERKIGEAERQKLAKYAPKIAEEAVHESDVMRGVISVLHPEREVIHQDERVVAYDTPEGRVFWMCPPARDGRQRANTDDTLHFLDSELGDDIDTAVGVTNDIYREFQHVSGLIEMRADIATVGFTPQEGVRLMREAGFDDEHALKPVARTPDKYVQELKSTVDKYVILDKKLREAHANDVVSDSSPRLTIAPRSESDSYGGARAALGPNPDGKTYYDEPFPGYNRAANHLTRPLPNVEDLR